MNRWLIVGAAALAVAVSLAVPQRRADHIETRDVSYRTTPAFNALGFGILVILVAFHASFW